MDILQVAKRAKVSTATVSRVLNGSTNVREKTSAHVRRVIAELNYIPNRNARNLRVGRTRLFGLIVSDINNSFFPELIDAFESHAAEQGIEVIFTHTNYDLTRLHNCVRRMIDRNVDAIAVMTSEVDEKSLKQAITARIPLVLLNQREFEGKYPNVVVEYATGFEEALEHLQVLGHHDIGFIAGPNSLNSAVRRKEAFQAALRHHGLRERPKWIVVGDMRVEGGRIAMETLLSQKSRPTAVLASNDLMAMGALQAAHAASIRVPEDISIIGFDDLPVAGMMYPPLTTMRLPRREIAARAFANLQTQLLGETVPARPPIQSRLVVRESTAPPAMRTRSI
ncbi:MAG TPA: LacI family DNA-binding transcriptional regulator [Alloacidobacterium sp.]|nr:LacI family DNA-binding transcriptional regulator [Alloacidobacterium sp.]